MAILITSGTGYVGSQTCEELLETFSNSKSRILDKIKNLSGNRDKRNVQRCLEVAEQPLQEIKNNDYNLNQREGRK